jgi:hypothetical protein
MGGAEHPLDECDVPGIKQPPVHPKQVYGECMKLVDRLRTKGFNEGDELLTGELAICGLELAGYGADSRDGDPTKSSSHLR